MRILIPNFNRNDVGGASTFNRNFAKGILKSNYFIIDRGDYDILFITGATLCERDLAHKAKEQGKKIVLRIDNILEDSKNRNSGMPRIRDFAKIADKIIYQSNWAKKLMTPYAGDGQVIYNGVDTDIFYPAKVKRFNNIRVLYGKHSRNEVKNWHYVQYFWREYNLEEKGDILVLVGNFSEEIRKINNPFEFHNNEKFEYKGRIGDPKLLADIIRSCNVAYLPYSFDACSNMILEVQACGVPVIISGTGGSKEILFYGKIQNLNNSPYENVLSAIGEINNKDIFENKFTLNKMIENYIKVFDKITK